MKKNSLKKQNNVTIKRYILWITLIVILLLLAGSLFYIAKLNKYADEDSKRDISTLINAEEERRYKYPPIDAAHNKVYIPEVHIFLPLNTLSRDVRYNYFNMKDHEAIFFSLSSVVGRQNEYDNPNCDKMVALTQTKEMGSGSDFTLVGTIPSNINGFKYVYRHISCQLYSDSSSKNLADTIMQIRRY